MRLECREEMRDAHTAMVVVLIILYYNYNSIVIIYIVL